MSTVINTNLASLFAQNSLSNAQNNLATSVQRLSSGLRINSAKDDAAGLAISQNMQSQINGTNQSVRNLSDATNLLQTADSSLSSIHDMLLRLKQLATQGYDGSLSTSQKLDIVQEMKDLNTEINATASRTQFNGINLLSSGSTVDAVNSDIQSGTRVVKTAVSLDITTANSLGLKSSAGATNTLGDAAASTFDIVLDPNAIQKLPGTYTFSSNGANLTMNGTVDGLTTSQTVTVADAPGDSAGALKSDQTLNFDKFGVKFNIHTTIATLAGAETGATIAARFNSTNAAGGLIIAGVGSEVQNFKTSATAPGSYVLTTTAGSGIVTMTNGGRSQSVTLAAGAANATQNVNFDAFGISFDLKSYQAGQTAGNLGDELVALNAGPGAGAGTIVISSGNNSALKFQSGPASDSYIQINTLNVQTGTSGSYAGNAQEMTTLGTRITGTAAGNLGTLGNLDTIDTWQTAFKNAAAAVDNAIEYISTQRATYGSQMNRLSFISSNLQAQSTNLQNSRSAIMDTDFAAETAKLTKGQIMQQAATAMLAQANQMPNVILSLLK